MLGWLLAIGTAVAVAIFSCTTLNRFITGSPRLNSVEHNLKAMYNACECSGEADIPRRERVADPQFPASFLSIHKVGVECN